MARREQSNLTRAFLYSGKLGIILSMNPLSFAATYITWHYSAALIAFWKTGYELLRFLYHFFSVPVLVGTLFSPWRRLGEHQLGRWQLGAWLSSLIVNGLMRLVGSIIRLIFLLTGILVCLGFTLLWPLCFLFWLAGPLMVILFWFIGFYFLLHS